MRLETGDPFPTLSGPTVDGGSLSVPDDLDEDWAVVVIYRGWF